MTAKDAVELTTRVKRTVQQLVDEIRQLPDALLYREPAPGEWPVMSTLAHLSELLPYWAQAGASIAAEPGKHVGRPLDDPRRVGPIETHGHDSLDSMLPNLTSGLDECVRILEAIPSEGWDAVGQHPRHPSITARELVERYVCNHAEEHATQIRATLQALQSTPR